VLQHSLSMFAFSLIFVFDALVDFPRVTRDRKLRLVFVGTGSGCKTEIGETKKKKKKRKTGEVLRLFYFSTKRTSFCESCFTACGLTEDGGARCTEHDSSSMTEHSGDLETAWAFDIHEE